MSRIGKKPIVIPGGVKVEVQGRTVKASGPKGTLQMTCHPDIAVNVDDGAVVVSNPAGDDRVHKALHGTMRALVNNMITGVSQGFSREMKVFGTGFNVKEQGGKLVLQVGYCHPVEMAIPKDIKVDIKVAATKGNDVPAIFTLSGPDKHALGQFAANVRRARPPEPYQGKGIRYADEHIIRKEGKALGSGG
ncbi:MAG TPA: 50S ribosomal protein L6 [Phycisphaerales bacterium]|nr:50S ribosomal protein L6 [Phycisphaerales bacterium]